MSILRRTWPSFFAARALLILLPALILLLTAAVRSSPDEGPHQGPPGRHPAILPGERLVFSVGWGPVKAGTATMEVMGIRRMEEQLAFHVVTTAASNSVFDKVYPVRDRIVSLMEVDSLRTIYFEKHLREGNYRADQSVRFDHGRGMAVYQDGEEVELKSGAYDAVAAFYRTRTLPLEVGRDFYFDSFENKKLYPIRVRVTGRERVTVEAGTFDCFTLEPTLKSGAFFKNEGKLTIWLTDDERRMPVLMKSKLPVGSISAELIEYHRPDPEDG